MTLIERPIYSAGEMAKLAKASPLRFQTWCNRGFISFAEVKDGRRTRRMFTLRQARAVAIFAFLVRAGHDPIRASKMIEAVTNAVRFKRSQERMAREISGREQAPFVYSIIALGSSARYPYEVTLLRESDTKGDGLQEAVKEISAQADNPVVLVVDLRPIAKTLEMLKQQTEARGGEYDCETVTRKV